MEEQAQDKDSAQGRTLYAGQSTKARPARVSPPISRHGRIVRFWIGFLGWYALTTLINVAVFKAEFGLSPVSGMPASEESLFCTGVLVNPGIFLLLLLLLVFQRYVAWGLLAALGANLIISLLLGLVTNAICFVPFFIQY